jgi:uncharacterized membrane protein
LTLLGAVLAKCVEIDLAPQTQRTEDMKVLSMLGGLAVRLHSGGTEAFHTFKRYMARGLLIGLDLLIAADIIKTVTLEATLENVIILGILVLIRTFLSWSLVLEVEGRWPWQSKVGDAHD